MTRSSLSCPTQSTSRCSQKVVIVQAAKNRESAHKGAFFCTAIRACARCATVRSSTGNRTLPGTPRRALRHQPPTPVAARWTPELRPRVMPARWSLMVVRDAQRATVQSIFSPLARNSARWTPFHSAIELKESKTGHSPSYGLPRQFFGTGRRDLRLDQTSLLSLTCG